MSRFVVWRIEFAACPGDWRLLPWISTKPRGDWRGWSFTWAFFGVGRFVLEVGGV